MSNKVVSGRPATERTGPELVGVVMGPVDRWGPTIGPTATVLGQGQAPPLAPIGTWQLRSSLMWPHCTCSCAGPAPGPPGPHISVFLHAQIHAYTLCGACTWPGAGPALSQPLLQPHSPLNPTASSLQGLLPAPPGPHPRSTQSSSRTCTAGWCGCGACGSPWSQITWTTASRLRCVGVLLRE